MLDRFDLLIKVPEVPIHMMMDKSDQETSADIRARVMAAQQKAKTSRNQQKLNADLSLDEIDATIQLDEASRALLHQAAKRTRFPPAGFIVSCGWQEQSRIWQMMKRQKIFIWPKPCNTGGLPPKASSAFRFNRVPNIDRQINPGEPFNFPQACW